MKSRDEPELHLRDIVSWGERLARHVAGRTPDALRSEPLLQDAVLYCVAVIGEAAGRLLKAQPNLVDINPNLELKQAYRMRNVATHGYDIIDLDIVWMAATEDVPRLVSNARKLLPNG